MYAVLCTPLKWWTSHPSMKIIPTLGAGWITSHVGSSLTISGGYTVIRLNFDISYWTTVAVRDFFWTFCASEVSGILWVTTHTPDNLLIPGY